MRSGIGTLFSLIALFSFLILFYLEGPAKSVTVRNGTLEVRNSIHRYEIPSARILTIEHMADHGVLVKSLTDALFATPAPADQRLLKATYCWGNMFLSAAVAVGLLVLLWVANGP